MKKIWEKYKEGLVLLVYLSVLVAVFMFVIRPLFTQIREKRNYAEEKSVEREITQKKIKELPQLKEKMEVVKQEEMKLDVFFGQDSALPLIEKLESLAVETGNEIKIEIVSENNPAVKDTAKKGKEAEGNILADLPGKNFIVMRLSLMGDFNSAGKFIQKIENMDYFSDLVSIKISSDDKKVEEVKTRSGSVIFNLIPEKEKVPENQSSFEYETPLKIILEVAFYQKG